VGRLDADGVRRAGMVAMWLGIAIIAMLTIAVIVLRFAIAHFFLGRGIQHADAAVSLAVQLLVIGATFFVTDGLQSIAAGALRGMNDTRVPLLFAAVSYWGIGFCSAYALAFHTPFGAAGVWIGLSLGTLVYATLLILRFRLLAARLSARNAPGAA
jgi:MATE family multidrug resistance protein